MTFADRLQKSIESSKSFIVAGFDPVFENFPNFILEEVHAEEAQEEAAVYAALVRFHFLALEVLSGKVAALKPNIAFFEQYGLGGLRAFSAICSRAKELGLPVIADVKRGDIGNTAAAYSSAFLGRSSLFGNKRAVFDVDAVTLSPFLGFDTLEAYLKDCKEYGKGIFVLVKTSNPGSKDLQDVMVTSGGTARRLSEVVAQWVDKNGADLVGECGYSSVGAVVGATYPDEAKQLRQLMPRTLFLIPGMGAQGGSTQDALSGFATTGNCMYKGAAVVNLSRGLFSGFPSTVRDIASLKAEINSRVERYNREIEAAYHKLA